MSVRTKYLSEFYKANGFTATAAELVKFALGISSGKKNKRFLDSLSGRDHADVFSEIYKKGLWKAGKTHSLSGAGSDLEYTENLRFYLPIVLERFNIRSIVDAPCGDFNWMKMVPLIGGMSYVGLDIVPEVIASNQKQFGDERRRFAVANIVNEPLPTGDVLICRDCLFHLSNADIAKVLKNFLDSKTRYLLTNTHVNAGGFTNTNINAGDFRLIDLFSEPFCLPSNVHYRFEDFISPFPPREMCLWDREQIASILPQLFRRTGAGSGDYPAEKSGRSVE